MSSMAIARRRRHTFGPARRDIGEHQRMGTTPGCGSAVVKHQVGLKVAGLVSARGLRSVYLSHFAVVPVPGPAQVGSTAADQLSRDPG